MKLKSRVHRAPRKSICLMAFSSFCSIAAPEELPFTPLSSQISKTKNQLKIPPEFQSINLQGSAFLLPQPSEHTKRLICLCAGHAAKASLGGPKGTLKHNISKDFLLHSPLPAPTTHKTNHRRTTLARPL